MIFFAFIVYVLVIIAVSEAWNVAPTQSVFKSLVEIDLYSVRCDDDEWGCAENSSRRGVLRQWMTYAVIGTVSSFSKPQNAFAISSSAKSSEKEGLMSPSAVADLIRPIPTFTIVDKKGIPFTVVGEDAKVTGYFFTTYNEAKRILHLAKASADRAIAKAKSDKETDIGENPWKNGRISTVPLDYAVTVVSKSVRTSGGGVYFKVAPAEEDINDALAVTGDKDLPEGKVPLFYYENFIINDSGKSKTPLYFRKDELELQWRRLNPEEKPPKISVTELFSVLTELVKPGGNNDELRNLIFVSPKESESKRQSCIKKGGGEPAFVVGKRIIVL